MFKWLSGFLSESTADVVSNATVRGGVTTSVGSGVFGLITEYQDVLSILIGIIGLIIAYFGYRLREEMNARQRVALQEARDRAERQEDRDAEYHEARMRALKD